LRGKILTRCKPNTENFRMPNPVPSNIPVFGVRPTIDTSLSSVRGKIFKPTSERALHDDGECTRVGKFTQRPR
jgi:hypothetical protein